jgi:acetyl esterase/lipase
MISEMVRASGATGVGLNFRLAPEYPYPASLEDAVAGYCGLLADGVDPRHLVVTGDSAGGALAVSLMVRLRDEGIALPRAALLMSPWVDLTCPGETMVTNAACDYLEPSFLRIFAAWYIGGLPQSLSDRDRARTSPTEADLQGLPPLLIHAGGAEVFLSDIETFACRARAAGVEVNLRVWEGMVHAFQGFTLFLEPAREAMADIGQFLRRPPR